LPLFIAFNHSVGAYKWLHTKTCRQAQAKDAGSSKALERLYHSECEKGFDLLLPNEALHPQQVLWA
jgi:hypothetical protein